MSNWSRSYRSRAWFLVAFLQVLCPLVLTYESGAPLDTCASMAPGHGIDQQDSESPYSLGVSKAIGDNGDVIVVTIISPKDSPFAGFFLQARDATNKSRILPGIFSTPADTRRQSCPPESQNTLTHANKNPKENLTTVWTPPPNFDGQVIFRATVAERFELFWMDMETSPLSIKSGNYQYSSNDAQNEISQIPYDSCGQTAGCVGMPLGCQDSKNCVVLVVYTPSEDGVDFQLIGTNTTQDSYIAVGLSNDASMGDDSVTGCIRQSSGVVTVQPSWNFNKPRHGNKALLDGNQGIGNQKGEFNQGVLTCRWKRQLITTIEGQPFNMNDAQFYLLLAQGPVNDLNLKFHKHFMPSNQKMNLTHPSKDEPHDFPTYQSCGVTAGCFGMPSGCLDRQKCDVLLSYTPSNDSVDFQLVGSGAGLDSYIAVGLSDDTKMGDDSVTGCIRQSSGVVIVQPSWNFDKPKHGNKALLNGTQGISKMKGLYEDDVLTCRWTRQLTTNVEGITFNLTATSYYLLLAKGPSSERNLRKHSMYLVSNDKANLTNPTIIAGKPNYLVKIHGAFMVAAWVGFVSVAILLARHYKNVWENDTLCTLKVWFALHRSLMLTGVSLIIAAFVCIFIHVDGWSQVANPHPILGCVCTGLAVLQPIMAIFRPSPTATNRYIFNWLHWAVGNSAQIIAVVTMFYAVDLSAVNLGLGFYYVLISFVGFHFCFHVIMQFHTYAMEKKVHDVIQMHDLGQKQAQELSKDAPGSGFRRFMLGIYIVINAGIVTALVLLVILQ